MMNCFVSLSLLWGIESYIYLFLQLWYTPQQSISTEISDTVIITYEKWKPFK